jgi:hypothetical protein
MKYLVAAWLACAALLSAIVVFGILTGYRANWFALAGGIAGALSLLMIWIIGAVAIFRELLRDL